MINKFLVVISVTIILGSLTSCFSTYPIQKTFPCEETSIQEKLSTIKDAYNASMKPKNFEITEKGVSMKNSSYNFDQVLFVRAQTKSYITGRKYWIQIKESTGEMNVIFLKDFALMEKANNALMCLTNLQETNGRQRKTNSTIKPKSNKFDDLNKLKGLLDSGAITQEEYDIEKAKILKK